MKGLDGVRMGRHDGDDIDQHLTEIGELYEKVYAEPPYHSGPLFTRDRFRQRTDSQKQVPGFALVAAYAGPVLVGFTFGLPFGAGRWWGGTSNPEPPAEVVDASKFAVIELVVHSDWRGRGLGRALLGALLDQRTERYAILLAEPTAPARQIYARWDWKQVCEVQPAADAPWLHALARSLSR